MAVEINGKPSPESMKILWDTIRKWYEAGCLRYTCKVCYSPLANEGEMTAQLCVYHLAEEREKIVYVEKEVSMLRNPISE